MNAQEFISLTEPVVLLYLIYELIPTNLLGFYLYLIIIIWAVPKSKALLKNCFKFFLLIALFVYLLHKIKFISNYIFCLIF